MANRGRLVLTVQQVLTEKVPMNMRLKADTAELKKNLLLNLADFSAEALQRFFRITFLIKVSQLQARFFIIPLLDRLWLTLVMAFMLMFPFVERVLIQQ